MALLFICNGHTAQTQNIINEMGEWLIYGSNGTQKATVKKLEYSGEFMGETSVTCDIYSPSPISFSIGDYLVYRGERFTIDYDATRLKQARNNTYGKGYTYENMRFLSYVGELKKCEFLDFVPSDNLIHFSQLPDFSFYAETVKDLADRLQANLDRIYTGSKAWSVQVVQGFEGKENINVSVSKATCFDALRMAYDQFEATFIIRGRTITIGTAGNELETDFKYGKGNGLKTIERSVDESDSLVTRLRAYGNTTNLPANYYKNIGMRVYAPIYEIYHVSTTGCDIHFVPKLKNACFSDKNGQYSYWVTVSLDETLWLKAVASPNNHLSSTAYSVVTVGLYGSNTQAQVTQFLQQLQSGTYDNLYFKQGINVGAWPVEYREYAENVPNLMAIDRLMLPGFPELTTDPYIDASNISTLGVREKSVYFDGSDPDTPDIHPTLEGMTAAELRAAGYTIDLDAGDNGNLDEIAADATETDGSPITADGAFEGVDEVPGFKVTIKDIGFDINDYLSTETATLVMKTGMCGGREFTIVNVEKVGNKYVLECQRTEDVSHYFPYNPYLIKAGDKFVLTNIEMPKAYIDAASQRLLAAAQAYIAKYSAPQWVYAIKMDDIWMQRQRDDSESESESYYWNIKEGDVMNVTDSDLGVDISEVIDRLTIREGYGPIPEFEVVLRKEKPQGTIGVLQNRIRQLELRNAEQVSTIYRQQNYIDLIIGDKIKDIQNQLDHVQVTYFGGYAPALNNEPASTWQSSEYSEHDGDMFYNRTTGKGYEFTYKNGAWGWVEIQDEDIRRALEDASNAQDTADGKRRVFVTPAGTLPTPPYDENDLWVNATYPSDSTSTDESQHKYYNDILKCVTPKEVGATASINDWTLASKYTDDSSLNNFINGTYAQDLANVRTQTDAKAETWYQSSDPSSAWNTTALKDSHLGDIWLNTTPDANGNTHTYIYRKSGNTYGWQEVNGVPTAVFDMADGKASIYVSKPTKYKKNDLWVIESSISSSDLPTNCVKGDIVISSSDSNSYNKAHWTKKDRYTDDTYAHTFDYISAAIKGKTEVDGGLVLTNTLVLRDVANDGTQGNIMSGINGIIPKSGSTLDYTGIAAWYGGEMIDREKSAVANAAKSLFRFDGSGYVASGNLSWDKNGNVTIQGYSINATTLQVGGSNVATQAMLDNFVSKAFFNRLFTAYDANGNAIVPNDTTTAINNLKIMVGTWTEQYLSALGLNSEGGGGGTGDVSHIKIGTNPDVFLDPDEDGIIDMSSYAANWNDAYNKRHTHSNKSVLDGITSTKVSHWDAVYGVVPSAAYESGNQLADKNFVNSSISTATATFRGTVTASNDTDAAAATALATITTKDLNDYAFVKVENTPQTGVDKYKRYKYNGSSWVYEYTLNNSSFTSDQWSAINSGITSTHVNKLNGIASGAQVNVIESVKVNGTALSISGKAVDITSVPLTIITGADDLKAIEGLSGTSGFLKKTAANTWALDTTVVLSTRKVSTGNGLQGGGDLSADRTISILLPANSGLSVASTGLKLNIVNDLDTSSAYRAISASQAKRIWDLLNKMFTLEGSGTTASPYVIKANYGLYTEQFLSALGQNSQGGSGGDFSEEQMWAALQANTGTYENAKINWNHIPLATASTAGAIKVGSTLQISNGILNQATIPNLTADVYTKVTVDTYGRVTQGGYLLADDIPTLSMSKISGLSTALGNVYTKTESDGKYVTAIGTNGNYLTYTKNGNSNSITVPYATKAGYAEYIHFRDTRNVADTPTSTNSYNGVRLDFKTSDNGTGEGGYSGVLTLDAYSDYTGGYPIQLGFKTAVDADDSKKIHIRTPKDADTWNAWRTILDTSNTSLSNGVIKINGNTITPLTAASNLAWSKVTGTPITLAGYGITDAYTKTEADNKYVTIATAQTITGAKTFSSTIAQNQGVLDDTPFKDLITLYSQNSLEPNGDNWAETSPSYGIGFRRFWTNGSGAYPSGGVLCAGIYVTGAQSWRGGLIFRTKNGGSNAGTHDTTALRLAPSGKAYFSNDVELFKDTNSDTIIRASNNNGSIELLTSSYRGIYDRTGNTWLIATKETHTFLPKGNVGIGTFSPSYKLDVNGTLGVASGITLTTTKKIKFGTANDAPYIELDANGYFHFSAGLYSDSFVSALGANDQGGSGSTFDEEQMWQALGSDPVSAKKIDNAHLNIAAWAKAANKPSYAWSEITNKPTWIGASKPTYTFSEITSKPTTLSGYGVLDDANGRYYALYGGTDLNPSSTNTVDLNTITTVGSYYCGGDSRSQYVTNKPTGTNHSFRMWVSCTLGVSTSYIRQRFQFYTSTEIYERHSNNGGSYWFEWFKVQDNLSNYASRVTTLEGYFTNGVAKKAYHVESSGSVSPSIYATVGEAKTALATMVNSQNLGIGDNIRVGESIIRYWNDESRATYASSWYSMTKIGAYDNAQYGQWLLSTLGTYNVGIVGRNTSGGVSSWTDIKWLAWTDGTNASGTWGIGITGNAATATLASTVTTTADTTNQLYLVGVTSSATNALKYDSSITVNGNNLTVGTINGRSGMHLAISSGSGSGIGLLEGGSTSSGIILISNELRPYAASANNVNLGSASYRWNGIYGTTLSLNGAITAATSAAFSSNVTVGGTLSVTGATTLSSTLSVAGLLSANGNVKTTKLYLYKPNADDTNAVYLTYDSTNSGVHIVGAGLYSDSYVSALGANSQGGGGSTFDEEQMWAALQSNTGTYANTKINSGHIPNLDASIITSGTFSASRIPLATSSARGGVKVGYTTNGKNYAVQLSNEQMYVNVPWENTTYESKSAASGGTAVSLVTTGEKYTWNNKQDAISDLSTIRSNATNGNTAYGWGNHANAGYALASDVYSSSASRTKNTVLAAPSSANGAATFRALVAADIPDLSSTYATAARATTLEGYFTDGVAKNAAKLSNYPLENFMVFTNAANYVNASFTNSAYSAKAHQTYIEFWDGGTDCGWFNFKIGGLDCTGAVTLSSTLSVTGATTLSSTLNVTSTIAAGGNISVTKTTTSDTEVKVTNSNGSIGIITSTNRGVYDYTNSSWLITTNGTNTWLAQGNVGIGTTTPSKKLDVNGTLNASGAVTFGSTLGVTGATTLTGLLTANGNIKTGTSNGAYIQIGAIKLVYDSTNNALKVIKSDDSSANFYATGAVSALGANSSGGSSTFDEDSMWAALGTTSSAQVIASSHIPNLSWNKITSNKPTTLSGYGITDAFTQTQSFNRFYSLYDGNAIEASSSSTVDLDTITDVGSYYCQTNTASGYVTHKPADRNIAFRMWVSAPTGTTAGYRRQRFQFYDQVAVYERIDTNLSSVSWGSWYKVQDSLADYASASSVTTLQGYFTNGVANSATTASKLSTVSKTAWGQTYWTSGGVPTNISGALSDVTNITMSGNIYLNNNQYIYTKDSDGTNRPMFYMTTANNLYIGYGSSAASGSTYVAGTSVELRYGSSRTTGLTLDSSGDVVLANSLILSNQSGYIYAKDSGGTDRSMLMFSSGNNLNLGSGSIAAGGGTYIYGNSITLRIGSTAASANAVVVDESKNMTVTGYVAVGTGGASGSYLSSDSSNNIYLHNSEGTPLVCAGLVVRRGSSASTTTLGSSSYPWGGVYSTTGNFSGNLTTSAIYTANGVYHYWKDSADADIAMISISSSNNAWLGYGLCPKGYQLRIGGNSIQFYYGTSRTAGMLFNDSGYLGVGNTNPSQRLHVTGNILASGEITASSDERKKNIISDTKFNVRDIASARSIIYEWNDGRDKDNEKKIHGGSIAQDWLGKADSFLSQDNDGFYSINYGALALCSAITIAREVLKHEDRITKLERENAYLKNRVNELVRRVA